MLKLKKDAIAGIRQIVQVQKAVPGVSPERHYPAWFAYVGTHPATGRKIQFTRAKREDVLRAIDEFYLSLRKGGATEAVAIGAAPEIKPRDALDWREARDALDMAGFEDRSVLEAVREFIRAQGGINPHTLRAAYEEYFGSFGPEQDAQKKTVRQRVYRAVLALDPTRPVHEVTPQDVRDYLDAEFPAPRFSPRTYNGALKYIKTFFAWCAKPARRYCRDNPAELLDIRAVPYREPKFMTPEQTETLFRAAEANPSWAVSGEEIWWLALSFFAGVRAVEIFRLTGKDVNLDEGWVRIARPKGYQHGIVPRMVQLPPSAVAWMRAYPIPRRIGPDERIFTFLPHADDVSTKIKQGIRDASIKIPRNGARHTFVSMHVAAYGDPRRTEIMAGTSGQMLVEHYMGLATRAQGAAYFAILPKRPAATSN